MSFFWADTHTSLLVTLLWCSRSISCTFSHFVLKAEGISEVIRAGMTVYRSASHWPKVIQLFPIIPSIPFKEKYALHIPHKVGSYIVVDIHLLNLPNPFFYLGKDFLQEPITVSPHHSVWGCSCVPKSFTEPCEPSAVCALLAEFFNAFNETKWNCFSFNETMKLQKKISFCASKNICYYEDKHQYWKQMNSWLCLSWYQLC